MAFTGSTAVGATIAAAAAQTIKRVTLELGGKSASLVFADADLRPRPPPCRPRSSATPARTAARARRILVERPVLDAFMAALEPAVAAVRVGDPLDEATEMGPLISASHRETVASYVPADAPVAIRGRARRTAPLYWFAPTVLAPVATRTRPSSRRSSAPSPW